MSDLTEAEIFDCMATNLRLAVEDCGLLATLPMKGPTYDRLRTELALIEGCCRQASTWREDTRWLPLGRMMAESHKRAGDWLRHHQPAVAFMTLAHFMSAALVTVDVLRHSKTGRSGPILPVVQEAPHRDTRPVQVMLPGLGKPLKSDILLPLGMDVG